MENFFNEQRVQNMLQQGMKAIGGIDLSKLTIPVSNFVDDFPQYVTLYDEKTFNFLAVNDKVLKFCNLESQEELENKDSFYLERINNEKNPHANLDFAHKVQNELSNTLSEGKPQMFTPHDSSVNAKGFCTIHSTIRTPVFKDDKMKGVLTINSDLTKYEQTERLYSHYKRVYQGNMKVGNKIFVEYLGLPSDENFILTNRQIEILISLAKHRTNINVARELDLAEGTISAYISDIKNRLHNQNLDDILLYFTTNDRRRF